MSVRGGKGSRMVNTESKGTGPSGGVRVSRAAFAKVRHLSDEELRARGIPARMLRRIRRKQA